MSDRFKVRSVPIGHLCRTVALALIGGVLRGRSQADLDAALARRSVGEQRLIVFSVLALLFALSLFAAQFGWIGMGVYWMGIILLIR